MQFHDYIMFHPVLLHGVHSRLPNMQDHAQAAAREAEMLREAQALNFEKAASLRDRLEEVQLQIVLEEDRPRKGARRGRGGRS